MVMTTKIEDMYFILLCCELRRSYERIVKVDDSFLDDRHYQL